jgi:hypothetical protein
MAVVELQFRERSFLELVGSEALRPPLASRVLDEVRRRNAEPQAARLRLTGVEWGQPFLRARAPEWGSQLVKVSLVVELTGQSARQFGAEAWMEVSVGRGGPCCRIAELRVVAPVASVPTSVVPLLVTENEPAVDHGAVLVGDGVVSVRLAGAADDDVAYAVQDRLHGHDWARFVPGELLAESVAGALDDALDAVTATVGGEIRVEERPTARWCGGAPGVPNVRAVAQLVGVGALPLDFDLPFTLTAQTHLALASRPTSVAPPMLVGATEIALHAADPDMLASFGALDLLREELRAGVDGRLDSTPAGAVVTADQAGSLRIESRLVLVVPATRAYAGVAVLADLDADGLAVRGILALRQPGEIDLRERHGLDWGRRHGSRLRSRTGEGGTLTVP